MISEYCAVVRFEESGSHEGKDYELRLGINFPDDDYFSEGFPRINYGQLAKRIQKVLEAKNFRGNVIIDGDDKQGRGLLSHPDLPSKVRDDLSRRLKVGNVSVMELNEVCGV